MKVALHRLSWCMLPTRECGASLLKFMAAAKAAKEQALKKGLHVCSPHAVAGNACKMMPCTVVLSASVISHVSEKGQHLKEQVAGRYDAHLASAPPQQELSNMRH